MSIHEDMLSEATPSSDDGFAEGVGAFLDSAHGGAPDQIASLISRAAADLGASSTQVWLADHEHRCLVMIYPRLGGEPQAIDGTMAGRAFITSEIVDAPLGDERMTMWVPLLDGVGRIGVLEVEVDSISDDVRTKFRRLAAVATSELSARGQYTDFFTLARRRRPMSLAGELQWQLLPQTCFGTSDVSVAGMLEPAYQIGGDAFDYTYDEGILRFAIFDAVGHDLDSSIVCALAVGAYRNRRRAGDGLVDVARSIDRTIAEKFGVSRFATGQLGLLDVSTGRVGIVNAGHPLPLLIRGDSVVGPLECPPWVPFGVGHMLGHGPGAIFEAQLEPGDALLLYSDGVVEARSAEGSDFGVDRLADFVQRSLSSGLSPAECLRRLSHAVYDYHSGHLQDDATMLLLRWHPSAE